MKIGVITYKTFNTKTCVHGSYEERVQLDNYFNVDDLITIATTDNDFKKFEVFDETGTLLYSTATNDDKRIEFVKVARDVEILGTTYDAFADRPYTHKTKVTWKLSSGGYCKTKKDAEHNAKIYNDRVSRKLTALVEVTA